MSERIRREAAAQRERCGAPRSRCAPAPPAFRRPPWHLSRLCCQARAPCHTHRGTHNTRTGPVPSAVPVRRINFAVDFRCDFPMYYSHSEIMIHSEIDSLRLMPWSATGAVATDIARTIGRGIYFGHFRLKKQAAPPSLSGEMCVCAWQDFWKERRQLSLPHQGALRLLDSRLCRCAGDRAGTSSCHHASRRWWPRRRTGSSESLLVRALPHKGTDVEVPPGAPCRLTPRCCEHQASHALAGDSVGGCEWLRPSGRAAHLP
eukprot:COSAG06_NODE_4335_length_4357_cov_120.961954_9_plen_261_part_00